MNAFKQKYKFSSTFKIGTLLILIFSGIGIAFGFGLFIFGMAWLFMGVYQGETVKDSNVTWGIVMMVLGFYASMMNTFALFLGSNAINKRKGTGVVFLAIIAIAAIIPMVGGIIILFTPIDEPAKPKNDDDQIQTFERKNPESSDDDKTKKKTMDGSNRAIEIVDPTNIDKTTNFN